VKQFTLGVQSFVGAFLTSGRTGTFAIVVQRTLHRFAEAGGDGQPNDRAREGQWSRQQRAHSKVSELSATISGYLGASSDEFDKAMGRFALAYADQAERDHATLKAAVKKGKITREWRRADPTYIWGGRRYD
jgi:hypothetical protein